MSLQLGRVQVLGADAIGQPGQRRFRLFVSSASGSAILWMEKQQLQDLSLALDRFLAQLTQGEVLRIEAQAGGLPAAQGMPSSFPKRPDHDFQVGQLRINYNEDDTLFLLNAVPLEIIMEPGQEPRASVREEDAVNFQFTQKQAQELTSSITAIVSSGRPVCPLCGSPLDGTPHACIKQNGHHKIIQVEEEE